MANDIPDEMLKVEIENVKEPQERDGTGLSYITSLIFLYSLFFISLIVIAWFGLFSEV